MRPASAPLFVAVLFATVPALADEPPVKTVEPVPPPAAAAAADDTVAYALGHRIGSQVIAEYGDLDLDRAALARGVTDAITGAKPALDDAGFDRAMATFVELMARRQEAFAERVREAARTNLAKGREFLAANAKRPGVVVRPSGLQYEVLAEGTGPAPRPGDLVVAHYRGTHIDGSEFDATDPQGEPATFPLDEVVRGWQEALPLMKAGAKWRIWIPAELGYGEEGSPPAIWPNEALVFEIELIRSEPAPRSPKR